MTLLWPEAVSQADMVCLGTVASSEVSKPNTLYASATVHVNVVKIIKGTTAQKQITIYYWNLSRADIPTDKYVIFFLRDGGSEDGPNKNWGLLDTWDQSMIKLGNDFPLLPPGLTPFRATGLLMANALAHADHERRGELLDRLDDAAFLYRPIAPHWVDLARQVGEPKGIFRFWEEQIVPQVKPYVHDPDKEIARVAQLVVNHRL